MALALLASSTVSFALSLARPGHLVNRAGNSVILALDAQPTAAYNTTAGGLMLKSVRSGSGELPEPGQIVTVKYSTTLLGTGQVLDRIPEISFVLGTTRKQDPGRRFAWGAPSRTLDALPLLQEAMVGMRVGDSRRVSVPPSSEFVLLPGQTVQLELELVEIKAGRDAVQSVEALSWQRHSSLHWLLRATPLALGYATHSGRAAETRRAVARQGPMGGPNPAPSTLRPWRTGSTSSGKSSTSGRSRSWPARCSSTASCGSWLSPCFPARCSRRLPESRRSV